MMDVHSDVRDRIVEEKELKLSPDIPAESFIDRRGNLVRRLTGSGGEVALRQEGISRTDGRTDEVDESAEALAASDLPPEALPFLRPTRYCETNLLSDFAWANFGEISVGWAKAQAICDFVHQRLRFSYPEARETRTATEAQIGRA